MGGDEEKRSTSKDWLILVSEWDFFFFQTGEMNAFIKARKILFHVDITTKHKNYGFGDGFFKNCHTDNIIHVVGASGHRAERDL